MKIITVEDMYNKSIESGSKLFPLLNLDFWNDYSENSEIFDRRFCNLYSSFFYYAQRENDTVESVLQKFKDYVGDFLYFNSKKYSELYRINNISDTAYSITDNYSTTETLEKENTNTSSEVIGEKANTETTSYGSRQDNSSTTLGSQTNTTTDKVSTYDSEDFYNKTNTEDSLSERTDSTSSNIGEHTDTTTSNSGEQTNTTNETSTESYTLTKKGNIGVKTVSEILNEHNKFWNSFSFYDRIFKDICSECLLV